MKHVLMIGSLLIAVVAFAAPVTADHPDCHVNQQHDCGGVCDQGSVCCEQGWPGCECDPSLEWPHCQYSGPCHEGEVSGGTPPGYTCVCDPATAECWWNDNCTGGHNPDGSCTGAPGSGDGCDDAPTNAERVKCYAASACHAVLDMPLCEDTTRPMSTRPLSVSDVVTWPQPMVETPDCPYANEHSYPTNAVRVGLMCETPNGMECAVWIHAVDSDGWGVGLCEPCGLIDCPPPTKPGRP